MNQDEPRLPGTEETKLELPDTPINRLLSQTDAEPPNLFSSFTAPTAKASKTEAKLLGPAFFFFGVGIPASAILLELVSGVCANAAFDPLPTLWHVLLVCAVPLANLLVWRELRNDDAEYDWRLSAACGLAVGVSGFYALLFLPLVPVSFIALLLLGLGILGFSPQLAFAFAVKGATRLRRLKNLSPTPQPSFALTFGAGVVVPLALLIGMEAQTTLTRINLQRATSGDPATQLSGIRFLRAFGSRAALLDACYWRAGLATDLIGSLFSLTNPVDAEKARGIFYRVTGEPFDSLPRPSNANNRLGPFRLLAFDDNIFDANRGGERVGGVIKGLSLAGSRIDGSLDADAALGYFEWTMIFKNESLRQQEARAQIQLPPGGVVSRLTLWVNGEEREAAFASRGKVQAAYQSVVIARRDPVLVTSSGKDRVLVQCFPVPPSGEMKIRFGVTAPVALESKQRGWLKLPGIAERNFAVEKLNHAVWFESKRALQSSDKSLMAEHPENRLFAVRGQLSDGELSAAAPLRVERDA
ncbi:MAG TPA: VIT domain-containing protein, partial [Blastocatellia bacterium]|nr:VIT domain-containing protein [Blastocatellia bacterium]